MVGSNLPPGTTHRDIDKHFGAPDTQIRVCEAVVDVELSEDVDPADVLDIRGKAVEEPVVHTETVEEAEASVIKVVYVGCEVDTQFTDERDIAKEVRKGLTVEATDDRVLSVQHVETEVR